MRYSKLITVSSILIALLLFALVGCDKRSFEPDNFEIKSLTAPETLHAGLQATIEAKVVNKNDVPAVQQTVTFKSDYGNIGAQAVTDEFGLARTTFYHNVADTLTATIEASIDKSSKTAEVLVIPFVGEYAITSLTAEPDTIYADNNITFSTIKATVVDGEGFPVIEETVNFKTNLGNVISRVNTDNMGVATSTFWDSGSIGTATITAQIASASKTVNVEVVETPAVETVEVLSDIEDLALETDMTLRALAINALGDPVSDGTIITFTADQGFFPENSYGPTTNGQASVFFNTHTTAGPLTVTARVGDVVGTKEGNIKPGLPASVSVTPQIQDDNGAWVNMPPSGIPVNYPDPVRVRARVIDLFNNVVPNTSIQFETDMGGIGNYATTDEEGIAYANYFPGNSAGTAQITASTIQVGEDGESIVGIALITIYSDEVNSIIFSVQEEMFLDVIGVGGTTSRSLEVQLRDFGGNLVSGQHMVLYEIVNADPPAGVNINNSGLSDEVQANDGIARASINSGTGSGAVTVKASLVENPDINSTKPNIVIRSGPAHTVTPTISGFDDGENIGGGRWRIEAGAWVKDIHNNPVIDGTAVWFSLGDTPVPPGDCYVDGGGYTGNSTPSYEDGTPGFAGTFLYYHGRNTFDQITLVAQSGDVTGSDLVTLPLQEPQMELQPTQQHIDYDDNSPANANTDVEFHVSIIDGQGNNITGANFLVTATHGQFRYFAWYDDQGNPINDPSWTHPNPYYIKSYNGMAKGTLRTWIWECPAPNMENPITEREVLITAFLQGTNTSAQGSFIIRRYFGTIPMSVK